MATDMERPAALVAGPRGSWRDGAGLDWALANMRELVPTRRIPSAHVAGCPERPRGLAELPDPWQRGFHDLGARQVAIWRDGTLTRYDTAGADPSPRLIASVTKSIIGLLMAEHLRDGDVQADVPVATVAPSLASSGYATATVGQLLDMRTSVGYRDAQTPRAVQEVFHGAIGLLPVAGTGPASIEELLETTFQAGAHGTQFRYDGVTTEVLAVVIRELTGRSLRRNVVERVWTPMDAVHDGDWVVDPQGWEHAAGGVAMTAVDLARFGRLVGEHIRSHPRSALGSSPGGYRSHWWSRREAPGAVQGHGQWGQWLHVDPARDVVVACLGLDETPWSGRRAAAATTLFTAIAENRHGI